MRELVASAVPIAALDQTLYAHGDQGVNRHVYPDMSELNSSEKLLNYLEAFANACTEFSNAYGEVFDTRSIEVADGHEDVS